MAQSGLVVTIRFAWWFQLFYWPMIMLGVACGIAPNLERVEFWIAKAMTAHVEKAK